MEHLVAEGDTVEVGADLMKIDASGSASDSDGSASDSDSSEGAAKAEGEGEDGGHSSSIYSYILCFRPHHFYDILLLVP